MVLTLCDHCNGTEWSKEQGSYVCPEVDGPVGCKSKVVKEKEEAARQLLTFRCLVFEGLIIAVKEKGGLSRMVDAFAVSRVVDRLRKERGLTDMDCGYLHIDKALDYFTKLGYVRLFVGKKRTTSIKRSSRYVNGWGYYGPTDLGLARWELRK